MYIISYKRFMFKGITGDTFITKGGGVMEAVPDWVRETRLYALASSDGDLVETVNNSDKAANKAAEKAKRTRTSKSAKAKEAEEVEEADSEEVEVKEAE